jgi:hypothetical protein
MATTPRTGGTGTDSGGARFGRSVARRGSHATETRHSSKTSEFYAYIITTVGVLIAGLLTKAGDGHDDRLNAHDTWLIVGILTAAYMISRGLAKAGSYERELHDGPGRD